MLRIWHNGFRERVIERRRRGLLVAYGSTTYKSSVGATCRPVLGLLNRSLLRS